MLQSKYIFMLAQHPGQGVKANVEPAIFRQAGLSPNAVLILNSKINTAHVAAISNFSMSAGSTCGMQSIFIGVPSMYVAESASLIQTVGTSCGLIPISLTSDAAVEVIVRWASSSNGFHFNTSRLSFRLFFRLLFCS